MYQCTKCKKEQSIKTDEPHMIGKVIAGWAWDANLCFRCNFWMEKVARKNHPDSIRANGKHYNFHPMRKDVPSHCLGYGGLYFKIKWFDGREAITNNLWHQGAIPEIFKADLPDNAEVKEVRHDEACID